MLGSIAEPIAVRQLCQPVTTRDALGELLLAAAAGVRLTLLDPSLTADETRRLGIDPAAINRVTFHPAGQEAGAFPRWLTGTGFSLELFTSGSTGLPVRVEHTLATLGRAVRTSAQHADDVWALALPPTHIAGVQVALQALANWNTLVDVTRLRADDAAEAIVRNGVTHVSATPTYYRLLAATKRIMAGVRAATVGGEPSDQALLGALREVFPNARLRNVYASTEAGTVLESEGDVFRIPREMEGRVCIRDGRLWVARALMGRVVIGETVKRLGGEAVIGETVRRSGGEAVKRSPGHGFTVSRSHGFTVSPSHWHDTGDCVEVVSEAPLRFRIIGRWQEWVNVGGDKVNPREVEGVLRTHPAVLDVVVYGRANSVTGALLEAEVVRREAQLTETELRAFAAAHLQPFKVPRIIRFVERLATGRSGKSAIGGR